MSSSNCFFLTCIQVSQEVGQGVWYFHLFQNFPLSHQGSQIWGIVTRNITEAESKWNSPLCTIQMAQSPNRSVEARLEVGFRKLDKLSSIQLVVFQSLSRVWLFVTPWTAARQASLSFTTSWSLLNLMSAELVIPSNHLILCHPLFLLLSIFSSIRVFSNEMAPHIKWPKYWSLSFSISPSNEYSGLISLRINWFAGLILRTLQWFPILLRLSTEVLTVASRASTALSSSLRLPVPQHFSTVCTWPPCCSSNPPGKFLPRGLTLALSPACLECFSIRPSLGHMPMTTS